MSDQPRGPDAGDRESTTGTPRWVKVSWIIGLLVVLLFVIALLTGNHGPGRHTMAGDTDGHTTASGATRYEQQP